MWSKTENQTLGPEPTASLLRILRAAATLTDLPKSERDHY